MNEPTALAVTAVRAVETTDRERASWTDADRAWASRAAAEVVGEAAAPEAFVGRRAQLALERLLAARNGVARFAQAWRWRPWVGGAFVVGAFVLGAASNVIGGWQRINILYSPIAPIVLWNLAVYLVLAVGFVVRYGEARAPGPLARFLVRLAGGARQGSRARDDLTASALAAFAADWQRQAAPLYAARVARLLHYAAAALATGVILGLYLRGLGLEYRATWESTFLDAPTVRAIAAILYAPGAWVTGLAVPDAAGIAAIRAPQSENAAQWVHLMAVTLAGIVIVPRVLLGLAAGALERHRARHLVDDLTDPYFQRLLRGFHRGALRVTTLPYSYTAPEAAAATLAATLGRALGSEVEVSLAAPIAYGDEELPLPPLPPLRIALFNAVATPERAAHGRFLATLAAASGTVIAMIDESALNARGANAAQRTARRALWQDVAGEARVPAVFVDLVQPDLAQAETDLDAALAGR